MMKLTRFKLALLLYVAFDFLIGGHCGGLLPLGEVMAAQSGPPAIGNITSAGSTCSTTSTPTNCVILQLDAASGAATIEITGTFVGTGQFEAFSGSAWTNINCTPPNSTTAASSATAAGAWQCNVAGYSAIRVRASAYVSGTLVVIINSAHASAKSSGGGAVYASGLGTNNVIPKGNGANQLADGTCTDNTNISCTGTITSTAAGTASLPSIGVGSTAIGFYKTGAFIGVGIGAGTWGAISNTLPGGFVTYNGGAFAWSSTGAADGAPDSWIRRKSAANFALGTTDVNGTPVDQTISVQNAITGSDLPGGHFTIDAPVGTGIGAGSKTCLNRALMGVTGTTAQSATNGLCVGESKKLSNTSATATSLVNISVPSNSSAGVQGVINVSCNDGTNFDSETNTFFVSIVNKAGAMTVGTAQLGTPSTANNSGSCTTAITAVAGTNSVDIKVTPVIGTIVPTIVTGTVLSLSSYATGNVTIN